MENSKKGNFPMHHSVKLSKTQYLSSNDEYERMSEDPT